jgi:hypothetical protein
MRRLTNVPAPVDTVNTLQEMLVGSDYTTEDGELVWCRSEQTLFVYRRGSSLTPDGVDVFQALYGDGVWLRLNVGTGTGDQSFLARGLGPNANVANLAAFTVAGNDGLTYVAGDVVLLGAQTTAAQNGPYVVGTVAAGVAPLTRPGWWPTGGVLKTGVAITLGGEGTNWKNTVWQSMRAAASFIIGTNDPTLFPRNFTRRVTLASAALLIANLPILSTSSGVSIIRVLVGAATTTIQYAATNAAGAIGLVAGTVAVGSLTITPELVAGNAAAVDVGDVVVTVFNQAA